MEMVYLHATALTGVFFQRVLQAVAHPYCIRDQDFTNGNLRGGCTAACDTGAALPI